MSRQFPQVFNIIKPIKQSKKSKSEFIKAWVMAPLVQNKVYLINQCKGLHVSECWPPHVLDWTYNNCLISLKLLGRVKRQLWIDL